MNRRTFLYLPPALLLAASIGEANQVRRANNKLDVAAIDRERILIRAKSYLRQQPITITATRNPRSAGGLHDFSSEGDYWWRDPNNPEGAYIQRDGLTNPDNFTAHREALMRLSQSVPTLVAAWRLTKNRLYALHAAKHLRAWFINPATLMNPNLQYAQAIKNKVTGRGIGIIDTIHLVEVARAAGHLEASNALSLNELQTVKDWFARYLTWMTTHPYGIEEREAKNNHGTCWVMQVAEFARLTDNTELTAYCRERFKRVLVSTQIAADGSFPLELSRTKPYGYALFNLDAMATICQVLSTPNDNLWTYRTTEGRGIAKALEFMFPFIADKGKWTYKPDVMYFDQYPMRHPCLVFGGLALKKPAYIALWRKLNPDPVVTEAIRNYPIRQPVLWL